MERRVMVLTIPVSALVSAMSEEQGIRFEGIPQGAKVLGVQACAMKAAIEIAVAHDSFDVVPEGQMPEQLFVQYSLVERPKS